MAIPKILVVDDEPNSLFGICQILKEEGFDVLPAESGWEALKKLKTNLIDVIVTDERMPDFSGMDLLSEVKKISPQIPVILITAYGSVSMAVEALKEGAYYFFEKPIFDQLERFLMIIRQAIRAQEMERELNDLRREVREKYSFHNIVGNHPKMGEIFEIINKISKTDKTVVIQGESGTGKDLIAKTIHYNSLRREKPLVMVNCGALTDNLLTSELFGHTKGAFTGAIKDTIGRFQMADGGTLVLDEIAEVPFHLQKTLLRIIEEKEFERVGDSKSIKVDVRIISTTNRNLQQEVEKGTFRKDLYYRISIVPIHIPPLRDRRSDIPLLVNYFLKKYQEGGSPYRMEPAVLEHLQNYSWPGNVRELSNIVQQMMLFCKNRMITMIDLPPHIIENRRPEEGEKVRGATINLIQLVSELEKGWIIKKLKETNGNQEKTAKLLGLTRKMLMNRINKYRLYDIFRGCANFS